MARDDDRSPRIERGDLRQPWAHSERPVPRVVVAPLQRFLHTEIASGVILVLAAIAALIWANSTWSGAYETLRDTEVLLEAGPLHLELTLVKLVNDLLMAVFFFVVGLEIKREFVYGELADRRAAAAPVASAIGGMVVPAALYLALNTGGEGASGWGIPVATDIAFALGVLALVGRHAPKGLRTYLLTLAIVDDIGAILIIALFYTAELSVGWLAVSVAAVVAIVVLQRLEVWSLVPYTILAGVLWFAVHESGIHATIAGVALGLLTPVRALHPPAETADVITGQLRRLRESGAEVDSQRMIEVARLAHGGASPLARLEHFLHDWSSYFVLPLFAFLNAGVRVDGEALRDVVTQPIGLGILLGLVVGKPVGVAVGGLIASRAVGVPLPGNVGARSILGVGALAGIGFTVSIFITGLAFTEDETQAAGKVAILVASLCAGVLGAALLRTTGRDEKDADSVPTPQQAA